jgi:hypothetical protein
MSTGTAIIESALEEINVISVIVPVEPEMITDGMKKLNTMIQLWTSQKIYLGAVKITTPGQDVFEPEDATSGIVYNLAIQIAPKYSAPVSAELIANARRELATIKRLYQNPNLTIPYRKASSTLPKGSGNNQGVDSEVFFQEGESLDG